MAYDPIQEFADRQGFEVGTNSAYGKTKIAYGVHNEIVFNAAVIGGYTTITACAGPMDGAQQKSIREFLKQNRKEYGIRLGDTVFGAKSVAVKLYKAFSPIKGDTIFLFIHAFSELLRQFGFGHGCSVCGAPGDFPYSATDECVSMVCEPCFENYRNSVDQIKQDRELTGSYFSGAVGALFGALVGVIPWVIVGMLGYLAAICGFVMAWLAFKGYTLMNGKFGKGAIAILVIVLLVMTPVAVLASNVAIAAQDGTLAYFDNNIFYLVAAFFLIPEVVGPLLGEFALGLLFTALGAFSYLRKVSRTTTSRDLEMVRM